jgi:hypothetical protein
VLVSVYLAAQCCRVPVNSNVRPHVEPQVSIEQGRWFYFPVDLDFKGFAELEFLRFVRTNDRQAAIVRFLQPKYFQTTSLILVPSDPTTDSFVITQSDILSVWTFDGSFVQDHEQFVDLKRGWPNNIMDKAAITPSRAMVERFTGRHAV